MFKRVKIVLCVSALQQNTLLLFKCTGYEISRLFMHGYMEMHSPKTFGTLILTWTLTPRYSMGYIETNSHRAPISTLYTHKRR